MFVAVHRVKPGKEEQFRQAWRRGNELITARYGAFGSRLHRDGEPSESPQRRCTLTGVETGGQ